MEDIREILQELRLTIGDDIDAGERDRQQARIKRMLIALGAQEEELDEEMRQHKQQQVSSCSMRVCKTRQPCS